LSGQGVLPFDGGEVYLFCRDVDHRLHQQVAFNRLDAFVQGEFVIFWRDRNNALRNVRPSIDPFVDNVYRHPGGFSTGGDGMKAKSYTRTVAAAGSNEIRIEDVDLLKLGF
jgi:hypothetical protein